MTFSNLLSKFSRIPVIAAGGFFLGISGAAAGPYIQTNLVSDIVGLAALQDDALKNSWGVSHGPATPFWISDQSANVTTLYAVTAAGVSKNALTVSIPTTGVGRKGRPARSPTSAARSFRSTARPPVHLRQSERHHLRLEQHTLGHHNLAD